MLVILLNNNLTGQTKSNKTNTKHENGSYLSTSMYYVSDAVFMGRKDSISTPYLYPSLTYHHKSGFYVTSSLSYLTKENQSRVDLFLASIGFDFASDNFSGDFSVTKYFFNNDSYNVISDIEADLTATLSYDFNIVNLSATASSYFNKSSSSDIFLSSEISHDFISSNAKFQISPTAGIYLGSQNFYEEYYINTKIRSQGTGGSGNGSGTGGVTETTITTIEIQESQKFNVMAYELSLPMWYTEKSFTISFLPAVVFPENEATLLIDETTVVKENLKETFYWIVGLTYTFN
ncbi:MAG: hypothetical protein R3342_01000 [Lutibacter sp.]|uniref:hypothetical protein n=1 Tax=Lutibacter sp. TaxID=1925666 RepID=UPI00299D5FBC|nr:hypothetical protein [Lutibacter sp.]MDX1828098.1 hypothetical protein [Lutibacter sp.]